MVCPAYNHLCRATGEVALLAVLHRSNVPSKLEERLWLALYLSDFLFRLLRRTEPSKKSKWTLSVSLSDLRLTLILQLLHASLVLRGNKSTRLEKRNWKCKTGLSKALFLAASIRVSQSFASVQQSKAWRAVGFVYQLFTFSKAVLVQTVKTFVCCCRVHKSSKLQSAPIHSVTLGKCTNGTYRYSPNTWIQKICFALL